MISDNVKVVRSAGGGCGICDDPIQQGETAVQVAFSVDLLITTKRVEKEIHVRCADELSGILAKCVREAGVPPRGGDAGGFFRRR